MTSSLPQSVLDMVEMHPFEDLMLTILRARIPDIDVQSLVQDSQGAPMILVRRQPEEGGGWRGDPRFVDTGYLDIECFISGLNADKDAALLSEAVRVAIRDAAKAQDKVPGIGTLIYSEMTVSPHRRPDWATSVGPVQYADLPGDWTRYESTFYIEVRRPR